MKRTIIKCEKCDREISKSNYSKHIKSCNGIKKESFKKLQNCPYCNMDVSKILAGNHIKWCKSNPNYENYLHKMQENMKIARNNISNESNKKRKDKIKQAWLDGKYNNVDYSKSFKGKYHTEESKKKQSEKRIKYLSENLDKHVWKRHDKFISKPCEYLKDILLKNNISFVSEFTPLNYKNYSIDISFPTNKIGLEINGNQHYENNVDLKPYYKERKNEIEKEGWTLVDIHYSKVYNKCFIDDLILFLNKNLKLEELNLNFKFKNDEKIIKCKNCDTQISKYSKSNLCLNCLRKNQRKVERPPYEQLLNEVKEFGYSGTGRKYGVSDTSIKKWIKNYEIND